MGKLTVDVLPRCQVTEGSAIKLQPHSLSETKLPNLRTSFQNKRTVSRIIEKCERPAGQLPLRYQYAR
jgi:hypothetical protein